MSCAHERHPAFAVAIAGESRYTKRKKANGGDALAQPMELLTMATHALPSSHILDDDAPEAAVAVFSSRHSLLRRIYDAVLESQQRRAHREIARVLGPGALAAAFRAELPPER
jgi:hypothetical protein